MARLATASCCQSPPGMALGPTPGRRVGTGARAEGDRSGGDAPNTCWSPELPAGEALGADCTDPWGWVDRWSVPGRAR